MIGGFFQGPTVGKVHELQIPWKFRKKSLDFCRQWLHGGLHRARWSRDQIRWESDMHLSRSPPKKKRYFLRTMFVFRGVGHGYVFRMVGIWNLRDHCECCAPKPHPLERCECLRWTMWLGSCRLCYPMERGWTMLAPPMNLKAWKKNDAYFWGMCYRDVFVRNNLESDFLLCPFGSIKPRAVLDTTKTIFDHAGCFWQEPCEFWCQVVALGTLGP